MKPELKNQILQFVQLTGAIAEKAAAQNEAQEASQAKVASVVSTIVDRMIVGGFIDAHEKSAAVAQLSTPEGALGVLNNSLDELAKANSARDAAIKSAETHRVKAATTLGRPEGRYSPEGLDSNTYMPGYGAQQRAIQASRDRLFSAG